MWHVRGCLIGAWIISITLGTVGTCAADSPAESLAAAARAAKAQFKKADEAAMLRAKTTLQQAIGQLDERFRLAGDSAADWKAYLLWDALLTQVRQPGLPKAEELSKIYARFAADNEGLGLVCFGRVRDELRAYLATVQASKDEKAQARYEAILDGLARRLEAYGRQPDPADAAQISKALRWLDDTHQATEVVASAQQSLRYPNLYLQAAEWVVAAGIAEEVDRVEPVRDCILGTDLYGTAHMVGQTDVQLVPNQQHAVFDTILTGTASSSNIGFNRGVTIYSQGCTSVYGVKRLWFAEDGILSLPACSSTRTQSTITAICAKRAIIERIAWKKAGKQKPKAEQVASQHAERRLNARMDAQAAENLQQANENYDSKFRHPLLDRGLFPQLQFSTTDEQLSVAALAADAFQSAALTAPPEWAPASDLSMRLHQSLFNNLVATALGGRTVHEATVQQAVQDLLGKLPEELKGDEKGLPWSITFADEEPITLAISTNTVRVTLRGKAFGRGEEKHPGMNVTATYRLVSAGNTFKAVRQGELEILPPDFKPGSGKQLSGPQTVISNLLKRRFGKVFKEEIVGQGLILPGQWKKAGTFLANYAAADSGWLTISWRQSKPAAPTGAE